MSLQVATTLLATLGVASAHTIMQAISVGGTSYPQGAGIYMPSDDSFIADVTSDSLACNGAPVTGFTSSSEVIPVNAGDTVTGAWLHTLTSTGPDSTADNKVIDSSHKGPVLAYMKKVADATQNPSAGPGDGWFKIAEAGLISSSEWAVDTLIAADGLQSVTIPTCIEDGDYLLRFELIALHSAHEVGGAQFYMECAQLRVSGGAASAAPQTYSIPGIYSADDPGISFMIFNDQGEPYPNTDYVIPGPPVYTCDGASVPSDDTGSDTTSSAPVSYSVGAPTSSAYYPTTSAGASYSSAPSGYSVPAASGVTRVSQGYSSAPGTTLSTSWRPSPSWSYGENPGCAS